MQKRKGIAMDLGLKDKVAVVVGGSSNIGRACSLRLVQEGAKVVIAYSSNDQKAEASLADMIAVGGEGCAYKMKGDMSKEEEVDKLFNFVLEKFGKIDILIYSAMLWPTNKVVDIPLDEWQRCIAVNLDGVFLTNRWLGNYWLKNGIKGGHILNFSSQAAFKGSTTFHAHYAAAKAGVVAFTVSFAKEVAKDGIYVNSIAPGMTARVGQGFLTEEMAEYYKTRIPVGRVGTPEEMADIVAFLVSPKNSYMIGATVDVSGGMLCR